jgi:hypothetical protein
MRSSCTRITALSFPTIQIIIHDLLGNNHQLWIKRKGTEKEKGGMPGKAYFRAVQPDQIIEAGIQISASSAATLPQVWQENFIAESLPLQTWLILTSSTPQKEQEIFSVVGLQR